MPLHKRALFAQEIDSSCVEEVHTTLVPAEDFICFALYFFFFLISYKAKSITYHLL